MRTLQDLRNEEKEIVKDLEYGIKANESIKILKSLRVRLSFIKDLIGYMETQPRPEYIIKTVADLEKRIQILEERFPLWYKDLPVHPPVNKARAEYESNMSLPSLRRQLRAMKYISADSK